VWFRTRQDHDRTLQHLVRFCYVNGDPIISIERSELLCLEPIRVGDRKVCSTERRQLGNNAGSRNSRTNDSDSGWTHDRKSRSVELFTDWGIDLAPPTPSGGDLRLPFHAKDRSSQTCNAENHQDSSN
jgi:hypothetical protein